MKIIFYVTSLPNPRSLGLNLYTIMSVGVEIPLGRTTYLEVPDLVVGDADGPEDAPLVVILDHRPALTPQRGVLRVAHVLA